MKYIVEMMPEHSEKKFYLTDDNEYFWNFCAQIESAIRFDTRMQGWQRIADIIEESISLGVKDENYYRVIGVKE